MSTEKPTLLDAVLAVQGEAPTLKKTASNPAFRGSKYTPLDEVVETVGPLLTKNGLVWMAFPGRDEHGDPALKYRLEHAPSKEFREGEMPLLLSKNDAQGQGSAITYARRYALCAVLNLVADDDDGNSASPAASPQRSGMTVTPDGLASAPQKKFLRSLITQNRLDANVMDRLFKGAGFARGDGEKVNDAINRLTRQQCSALIDEISKGAVKTGESDVPADVSEFERPAIVDDGTLPFDPSVPQ